jgi:hypothetical protein
MPVDFHSIPETLTAPQPHSWSGVLKHATRHRGVYGYVFLTVLAIFMCASRILHGSDIMDDWAVRAEAHFTGFGGVLKDELQQDARRPLAAIYFAALFSVIGSHIKLMLAVSAILRLAIATSLYALLRELRFGWLDSVAIAGLTLLFPNSDSTWLWPSASVYSLAVACVLLGCLVNVRAVRNGGRHEGRLRVSGIALISAGILTNELVVPLALASGALYLLLTAPRRALRSWGTDLLVLAIVIVTFTFHLIPVVHGGDNHEISSFSQMRHHAHVIFSQASTLLTHSLLPFGTPRNSTVLGMVGIIVALALVVTLSLRPRASSRRALVKWIAVATIGLLVIGLGYVMLVPANIYYVPLQPGLGNRINAVSAIGVALVLYAGVVLAAQLVFRELPHAPRLISGFIVLAVILAGVGYARRVRADELAWKQSGEFESAILVDLRTHVPTPSPNTSLVTIDAPVETAPGVPVFDASWDLNGAVELLWNDPTLRAFPMTPGMSLECATGQLRVNLPGSPAIWQAAYPVDVMDVAAKTVLVLRNHAACSTSEK